MKSKLLICILVLVMMILVNDRIINAEEINPNETNPEKVFPSEQVEDLIEEAEQLEVVTDPKAPMTRSAIGSYPRRKGVILVTDDKFMGALPVGHAGIIYANNRVVESNPGAGVELTPNNWDKTKNQVYGVTVTKALASEEEGAANYCYRQWKKPYNINYYRMDYRDKFYCSHLIRSAYLDLYNIDLNTGKFDFGGLRAIHPMELVNNPKTKLIYRKK